MMYKLISTYIEVYDGLIVEKTDIDIIKRWRNEHVLINLLNSA